MKNLIVRKHADRSAGRKYDPNTGHELPWPLAGVELVNDPDVTSVSTAFVDTARAEGWVTVEGEQIVTRPAGPADDPLRKLHHFRHLDAIVFDTIDGPVRYRVTHQPDKYADGAAANDGPVKGKFDDSTPVTDDLYAAGATRVDHFYIIEKES